MLTWRDLTSGEDAYIFPAMRNIKDYLDSNAKEAEQTIDEEGYLQRVNGIRIDHETPYPDDYYKYQSNSWFIEYVSIIAI
ncbi:hypothetical protein DASC09_042580 [Saccharomycopsis crataegensis]|uniref:Uncharacterized protein n=1 Tax=Saccharomycopsis crataegensis TaxID=43959 RepID=A0AAV5QPT9_9ASCO|nr:hypothetical protein DASC09_042580 [Saccharomycopsis crataegensis]